MAIHAKKTKRKDFEPAPEGLHQAVCWRVEEDTVEDTKFGKGQREVIKFWWQLERRRPDGSRYLVVQNYTSSTFEKANIWKAVTGWLGRNLSESEREEFDFESLKYQNCQLQIIHHKGSEGKTYARVQGIVPLGEGTPKIFVEDDVPPKDQESDAA